MSKYRNYCTDCKKETLHYEWTEDAYGASGGSRLLTSIMSFGMSNLATETYCKCLSCNKTKLIKD